MSDRIRILSIDGGGIRGIIPAMVVKALLGDLKAQDAFHIIAGTSTGGIMRVVWRSQTPLAFKTSSICTWIMEARSLGKA